MKRLLVLLALAGCEDALDQRLAIVRTPRVLAIVSEPPEVTPGHDVTMTALVAGPDGPQPDAPSWALCTAPKPPTEDNAIADGCIYGSVVDLGATPDVVATVPSDACRTFGPDVESTGFRPRDPDPTGGYYQPVRASVIGLDLAFGFTRITCNLANAPGDIAQDYKTMYVANANPTIASLSLDSTPLDPATPAVLMPDKTVSMTATWPDTAVETYLYYDPDSETLVTRRESMRVSWFATGGEIAVDASAVSESDDALSVTTTWHTPAASGPAWLWLVLRDSRGGIATATYPIDVR
jgi:hypothetical protein